MKTREPRTPVIIPARLRDRTGWTDATVLNMSQRGLMFTSSAQMQRGQYVELRRGPYVIVARVAWTNGKHCGARSQDSLPIDDIIRLRPPPKRDSELVERRASPRKDSGKPDARNIGRNFENIALAVAGLIGVAFIAHTTFVALSQPIQKVVASLAAQ
ncbi:PilZ domain-containing protein [Sphingomicrobium lutaoense]|uniref:PilZ domain-containing protein n=1 Tax=Sphingomicrobium lutaoense TaxID=515949 RepID=UPI001608118D